MTKARLWIIVLIAALPFAAAGCCHDPFACCDQRRSLADWFDIYGPLGCGDCSHPPCRHN